MKRRIKLLTALLMFSALFAAMSLTASAESLGESGVTWNYDESTKTLTFSGSGAIPDSITGEYKIYKEDAEQVVIEGGITRIGTDALNGFSSVTDINITSDTVTEIGNGAFKQCQELTDVQLPESLVTIGNNAFDDCIKLQNITLPNSVISIGDYAFDYCTRLETVDFSTGLTTLGTGAFRYCNALKTADLAVTKLTAVKGNTFLNCALSTLTLPVTLTTIEADAFNCASLYNTADPVTSVTIPERVVYIGNDAFFGLTAVTDVYCYADPGKLEWWEKDCDDFKGDPRSYTTKCHVPSYDLDTYTGKFNDESKLNSLVNVNFEGDLFNQADMGLGEHLYGYSLSLDGDIGVNFYMELPEALLNSSTAYMQFTIPSGADTKTEKVYVNKVLPTKTTIGSKDYYKFKCSVSAKDMASIITAQMFEGSSEGNVYSYSVKDYADYLLSHPEVPQYAAAAKLVKTMLNYGAAAQTYFSNTAAGLANEGYEDTSLSEVTAAQIGKSTYTATLPDGVTFEGATLSLKSQTTLSLYFKSSSALAFTCEGKTVDKETSNGYQIARIRNIEAKGLGSDFVLKIGGTPAVTYSPMNYCYNVLNDSSSNANLQTVCRALYRYWLAADEYFA